MSTFAKPLLIALFALGLLASAPPVLAQPEISGKATAVDGDTLNMDGIRIRLFGVDAPEFAQRCTRPDGTGWACGAEARTALEARIGNRRLRCEQRDIDSYRRSVAVCRVDGEDLNAWLVASGWAVAYREFSEDYVAAEAAASARRLNIWNGSFQQPAAFRREQDAASASERDTRNCTIKGNISSNGDRIYHVPGGEFYEQTVISRGRGERLFCSEQEARAAGWRRSRR